MFQASLLSEAAREWTVWVCAPPASSYHSLPGRQISDPGIQVSPALTTPVLLMNGQRSKKIISDFLSGRLAQKVWINCCVLLLEKFAISSLALSVEIRRAKACILGGSRANEWRMIHGLCCNDGSKTPHNAGLCCRIPLAVSQQSVRPAPTLSPRRASGVQVQAPVTRLAGGQGSADLVRDKRLGARAVTELDFSRHRVPTPGGQVSARAPSITDNSEQSIASPGLSPGLLASDTCIRKGVMWVQQEKLFSRWKERFIILTPSYLHIFKKSTSRLSDMGTFVNKVSFKSLIESLQKLIIQIRLSETENLSIEERKGYLTLVLVTARDSRLLLRKTEGIRDWQRSIQTQLSKEKQRHREMQSTNEFWNRKQFSDCQNAAAASQWLLVRDNIGEYDPTSKVIHYTFLFCQVTNMATSAECHPVIFIQRLRTVGSSLWSPSLQTRAQTRLEWCHLTPSLLSLHILHTLSLSLSLEACK